VALAAFVSAVTTLAAGTDVQAAFDAANKLYEAGRFREAAAAYENLLPQASGNAALYYNWGNAQFKAGHIGRALAAYRMAHALAPRDPDLRANLRFAREQVQGPTLRAGWRERLLEGLSLNERSLATAAALWLWLGLLALRQVRPAFGAAVRGVTWLAALATLGCGAGLALHLHARLARQTAIVVSDRVPVRNGPFAESPTAFTARDGAELAVLDRKDDWLRVSAGPRWVGWLPRDQVVVLPAG